MKLFILPLAALFLAAGFTTAQETPTDGLGLIPELPEPTTKPKGKGKGKGKGRGLPLDAIKKSVTEQASDDLQQRIRFRDVKTKALQDPDLQEEWDRAQSAKTDIEKREALKSYYTRLYDRMARIDRKLKSQIDIARRQNINRLTPKGFKTAEEDDEVQRETTTEIRDRY